MLLLVFALLYKNSCANSADLPCFFSGRAALLFSMFYSFQNSPGNLGPSYKMDLDLWECRGRVKFVLW